MGTADSNAKANSAYLISTESGICYRGKVTNYDSAVRYGLSGGGSSFYAGDGQVQAIGWRSIDFLLEPAPGAVEGSGPTSRRSLERCECKSDDKNKKKK